MERLRQLISRRAGLTSVGLQHEMASEAPHVSDRAMRRYRAALDLTPRRQRITAAPNPQHEQLRHDWAWAYRRAEVRRWLHSDESTMCVRDTGDVVWIPRGQPTPRLAVEQLRFSVNVWGAVWDEGRIFVRFEGHLSSQAFISILEEHLLPEKENIAGRPLLLDRLPAHSTATVKGWLTQHRIPSIYPPPHSPQFNAIEQCWA
jgi:transposase InsO family protein